MHEYIAAMHSGGSIGILYCDEFLVLCQGIAEEEMYRKIETLKTDVIKAEAAMALGHIWKPDGNVDMDYLIAQADQKMYEDKRAWYKKEGKII